MLFQLEVDARRGTGTESRSVPRTGGPLAKGLALSWGRGRTPLGVGLRFWVSQRTAGNVLLKAVETL